MNIHDATQLSLGFWHGRTVDFEPVDEQLSSDGGLLAFGLFDSHLGWTKSFAQLLSHPGRMHSAQTMLRQRVFGIIAGYEDQNDHDALRSDPIFKLLADRAPNERDLASQPTLSRFENRVTAPDLLHVEEWFLERFVESFDEPPRRITLDIDTFDDPTHGAQQLALFHGYYEQHQYQVRVISCAENDLVVLPVLLFGSATASLGAADDLARVIQRLRARFPDVLIHVRADAGFAKPEIYETLEAYSQVDYSIGYEMNPALCRISEELLQSTVELFAEHGTPQKQYLCCTQQARTWDRPRDVVIKCEVNQEGTNRRAVVTNRPGAALQPDGVYQEYADRGESENRHKELKCQFKTDRLSDHRYMANLFRLAMHVLAANLLVAFRQRVAQELPEPPSPDGLPLEARSPWQKRQHHNQRRREDPLGAGHACTWRMLVIKVATRVVVTTRRVKLLISRHWPNGQYLAQVCAALRQLSADTS